MTAALPSIASALIEPRRGKRAAEARRKVTCSACGTVCSDGTRGPGSLALRKPHRYVVVPAPWLCGKCSERVWDAYLATWRERWCLIQLSRILGYPARRSDLERYRRGDGDRQLGLFGGEG